MQGFDLDVERVLAPVAVVVFDARVGELHVAVLVRESGGERSLRGSRV